MLDIVNIPEVVISLRDFLTHDDLTQCVQVSKTWYHSFSPLLWRTLRTSSRLPMKEQQCFKDAIPYWGKNIQTLDVHQFYHLDPFVGHTRNLLTLLVRNTSPYMDLGWRFLLELTRDNPLITTLKLASIGKGKPDLLMAIRRLPGLQRLELVNFKELLSSRDLLTILTICPKLQALRVQGPIHMQHTESDFESVYINLKELDLLIADYTSTLYSHLVWRCPSLESTRIPMTSQAVLPKLCSSIQSSCPHLTHLNLSSPTRETESSSLEMILRGLRKNSIETLNLVGREPREPVARAIIECQSLSLQHLILDDTTTSLAFKSQWLPKVKDVARGLTLVETIHVEPPATLTAKRASWKEIKI